VAVTSEDRIAFVAAIIEADVFTKEDTAAIQILQGIINDTKTRMATKAIAAMDKEARKEGKYVSNKFEAIKAARQFKAIDENTITAAIARELGLDF